jgi:hypothetical protein
MLQLPVERPERVCTPSASEGQDLRLWGCGEQLRVEKLIPEPAIE